MCSCPTIADILWNVDLALVNKKISSMTEERRKQSLYLNAGNWRAFTRMLRTKTHDAWQHFVEDIRYVRLEGIYFRARDETFLYGLTPLFEGLSPRKLELLVGWPNQTEGETLQSVLAYANLQAVTHLTIDSFEALDIWRFSLLLERCSRTLTHLSFYAPIVLPSSITTLSNYAVQLPRLAVLEYTSHDTSLLPFFEALIAKATNLKKVHVHSLDPNYSLPVKQQQTVQLSISFDTNPLRSDWSVYDDLVLDTLPYLSRVYPNVTIVKLRAELMDLDSSYHLSRLHHFVPALQSLHIDKPDELLMRHLVSHFSNKAFLPKLKEICFRNRKQSADVIYPFLAALLDARNVKCIQD